MKTTRTIVGQKARQAVIDGVNAIYVPVSMTLGPQAKKALLYRTYGRGSRIVDDGYFVAECQEPRNPHVRMAAQAFREGTKRTNERVGDGTTTTTVIGGKLMNDIHTLLAVSASNIGAGGKGKMGVMTIRAQILATAEKVKAAIKERAKKVETLEELEKIAIVSSDDPEIGKLVADMAFKVGVEGFIDVVEGYKGEIETELVEGCRFPAKIAAKAFLNNPERFEMIAKESGVLITNRPLENAMAVSEFINPVLKQFPSLIIVAPHFSEEVLMDWVKAMYQVMPDGKKVKRPGIDLYPVYAPALRTEQFEDLAIYCGAKFFDKNKGDVLKSVKPTDAGFVEKLIVKDTENREEAVVIGGKGGKEDVKIDIKNIENGIEKTTPVRERIKVLQSQLKETRQEQFKKLLERRIASLASAGGVIRVGDSTDASALYRKLKIEDAVYACKAALRGGYVKGGGLCLKEIAETLLESDLLRTALMTPYELIQKSVEGGIEITPDIIDPAEMIYYAVEHATQIAANLATVEILTPEADQAEEGEGHMAMAKMMGEVVIAVKKHLGLLKESEEEQERDRLGGMTEGEKIMLDNG